VLGSNIFNILLILGVLFLLTPVTVAPEMLHYDLWILGGVTLLALPVMLWGRRITRLHGAVFVALYCAFLWFQFDPHKQGLAGTAGPAARAAVPSAPDPL
jgi:cation:H+ antiporter